MFKFFTLYPLIVSSLGWGYLGSLLIWFGLRSLFFDRFWWLALLNTFAPYLLKAISPIYPYHAIHPIDRFHTVALFSRLPLEAIKPLPNPPIDRGF